MGDEKQIARSSNIDCGLIVPELGIFCLDDTFAGPIFAAAQMV